jgi:hypothetical protein
MVETLETLYHTFVQYKVLYIEIFAEFSYVTYANDFKVDSAKYEKLKQLLDEFKKYFLGNRLFLPSYMSEEINDIWVEHDLLRSSMGNHALK